MIHKHRGVAGRTRVTQRAQRRAPSAVATEDGRIAEACGVARRFVAARWPELAEVVPIITARRAVAPGPALLSRLGLSADEIGPPASAEYTFTFAGERGLADGVPTPIVVNVTVDPRHGIVKTSVSR